MGCGGSKEAAAGGGGGGTTATAAAAAAKKKTPAITLQSTIGAVLDPALNTLRPVVATMTTTKTAQQQAKGAGDHLRNIFAKPLQELLNLETYKPPVHAKPKEERDFILQALQNNFVFESLSNNSEHNKLAPLVDAFEKCTVAQDEIIIQQGDVVGDYFYIIQTGTCQFLIDGKPVGVAGPGDSFGELALLYTTPRAATVQAIHAGGATLFRVDQATFRYILKKQTEEGMSTKNDLLQGISFLKELRQEERDKLLQVMQPKRFVAGEYLMKKGDKGDYFYILKEGKVKATDIGVGDTKYEDVTLGPGEYFGERAIMTGEPRMANVVAVTDGMCFDIDKDTFEKVLGNLNDLILRSQDTRVLSAIKIFVDSQLDPQTISSLAKLIREREYRKGTHLALEGKEVPAAMYLVRKGRIEIQKEGDSNVKVIEAGGYFGDEQLLADQGVTRRRGPAFFKANYSATVTEDCSVGILTLDSCRRVLDTPNLGKPSTIDDPSQKRERFDPKELKRHRILGAGTFGQVWLVSRVNSKGDPVAYALKVQSKYELIQDGQAQAVVYEKNVMSYLKHPFLISLVNSYHDEDYVYMVMDLIQGGELYNVIHTDMRDGMPEKEARFYAAGIAEGLAYMHNRGYVYRDLKPENVLINSKGYPVIIDFGFAKFVTKKTFTLCGTPLYLAPEVILNKGHDWGADHWSLGVLIFEMITGDQPFYKEGMQQMDLFRSIISGQFQIPRRSMSDDAASMVTGFLTRNPSKRLGSLAGGEEDVINHQWFEKVDFPKLINEEIEAPFVPKIKNPLDSSNFDDWSHLKDKTQTRFPKPNREQAKIFENF